MAITLKKTDGYLTDFTDYEWHNTRLEQHVVPTTTVTVYKFSVDDLSNSMNDSMMIAYAKIKEWLNSEVGQWIMNNAVEEPRWHTFNNYEYARIEYAITAKLKQSDATYWILKNK